MRLHPLLARIESIVEAPGNIQNLRKLAIVLAVSGRLGEQKRNRATPANDLLKVGKHARRATGDPIDESELPSGFTSTDDFVRLVEIAKIEKGPTAIQRAKPGNYPLVTTAQERSSCDHFDFDARAAIIPLVSSAGHGKATLKRLQYQEGKFALGNILCSAIPISEQVISARFIFEYLTAFKEELLVSKMTGTANVALTVGKIRGIPIPIVSPEIQQSLDSFMTLCDRLEAAQCERESRRDKLAASTHHHLNNGADAEALRSHAQFFIGHLPRLTARPDQVKQLRQTILNLAVCGKLVPQIDHEESVSNLLQRIQAEQKDLLHRRVIKGRAFSAANPNDEAHIDIPQTWQFTLLGNLLVFGPQNGISPIASSRSDAPRAITLTATTSGIFKSDYYKQIEANIPLDSEFWLRDGDLLFQRGNTREYVGMAALYDGQPGQFLYPDLIIKVRLCKSVDLRYIHLCSIAPYGRAYFGRHASGAQSTMPKINHDILVNLPIPLPPIAEQHRIVAKVDELMSLCDQLEVRLASAQTEAARLLESVLHHALQTPA